MTDVREIVGRYEVVGRIGRGGMGVVHLARQLGLDRYVALKELAALDAADPTFARRFLQEARVAGSMSHPNVVTVFDYFEDEGTAYIAMEYLELGSLRPYVSRISLQQAVGVLEGTLAGLAHAHADGVVHRDLKPENLLVTRLGGIKIADFGIAKALNAVGGRSRTATRTALGSPSYMAPEQALAAEIGPWTDLYALGIIAYELFVGRVPFAETDTPMAILWKQVHDPIPGPRSVEPDLDERLAAWIERLLAKDPALRPRTAQEAWDTLEDVVVAIAGHRWRSEASLVATDGGPRRIDTPPSVPLSSDRLGPPPAREDVPVEAPPPPEAPPPAAATTVVPPSLPAPAPARRGVARWIAAGVAAAVLAAAALAGALLLLGGGERRVMDESTTTTPRVDPTAPPRKTVETFSDASDSWLASQRREGATGTIEQGGYRIRITKRNGSLAVSNDFDPVTKHIVSRRSRVGSSDARLTVDAARLGGPTYNEFGLYCSDGSGGYYYFAVTSEGEAGIFRNSDAGYKVLRAWREHAAILKGERTNHLVAECRGGRSGAQAELRLTVNGRVIARARDREAFPATFFGVYAVAFHEPGVDVLFDNFAVERLDYRAFLERLRARRERS